MTKGNMAGIALAAACALGAGARAENYVWQGGASGAWNSPANWQPNGVPTGGDFAHFNADAEITDGFEIGEGVLTISNATATVHLSGVVSGAGALSHPIC